MAKLWPPNATDRRSAGTKAVDDYIESVLRKHLAAEDGAVPRTPKSKTERRTYEKRTNHNPLWARLAK